MSRIHAASTQSVLVAKAMQDKVRNILLDNLELRHKPVAEADPQILEGGAIKAGIGQPLKSCRSFHQLL